MSDDLKILIGEYEYTRFKSYRIEHDIYSAAAAFDFELYSDPVAAVRAGDLVKVYIGGKLELTGIVDRASKSYDNKGILFSVAGRDLMGLVVDSYCETWGTLSNVNLKTLAERLLKDVPFICKKEITYDEVAEQRDATLPVIQTSPGQKIFDILKDAAQSRGLLFYAREDGGLCFRKPSGRGACVLDITQKTDAANNYIIRGERIDDISERYSEYTVITQGDGFLSVERGRFNARAKRIDGYMSGIFHKPYVETMNRDTGSVERRAAALLEQRRAQSRVVKYTVKGHSQFANPWAVDSLVKVDDDVLHVQDTLLIYGRVFELSQERGILTHLTLGEKGLIL